MSKKYDLPFYSQMSVSCGISTFLMLINPKKNLMFKEFLSEFYNDASFLMKQNKQEFKWSVVITYVLLKSLGDNFIREFLRKKNPDIVDYYMPIVQYQLFNKKFSRDNRVNKKILRKSLNTMRTDADLKILFHLFGGEYFPQEQESCDGTGGLYFSPRDFKPEAKYKQKINLLKEHLNGKNQGYTPCIALNVGYHWVAVNSVDQTSIGINNPLSTSPTTMRITSTIPEHYRFYLFNYNQERAFILGSEVQEFLKKEISDEREP